MQILRGAELPSNVVKNVFPKGGIFPTGWYVIEDDGTTSGPFATAEQAEDSSTTPAMTADRFNDFLNAK